MESRIIIAVDDMTLEECLALGERLGDRVYAIKIHTLYDRYGNEGLRALKSAAPWKVWVDAKLHDIPTTVRLRAEALVEAGADMLSVHASGGSAMMRAAKSTGAIVYGITILTSLTNEEAGLIYGRATLPVALYLARLARAAGLDGIVSSPREVRLLSERAELRGWEFITPGIRSEGELGDDQQRTDTPENALHAGATRLVVGRQLTRARSPVEAYEDLERLIERSVGRHIDRQV